jgi:Mg/Co/Ni transporter MgtE
MMLAGAIAGLMLGAFAVRAIESLLYGVKATDALMLVIPSVTLLGVATLASIPAVIQAVRIDPAQMLRAE